MSLEDYRLPDPETQMWDKRTIELTLARCKYPRDGADGANIASNFIMFWNEYSGIPEAQDYIRKRAIALGLQQLLPEN